MSDIIIEGKNLSDINQSNFQTVGVRSGFYFSTTDPGVNKLSVNTQLFKYDTIETHDARLPDNYQPFNVKLPRDLLPFVTVEPWQGRLHYDKDFQDDLLGLKIEAMNGPNYYVEVGETQYNMKVGDDTLYYSYFYTGNLYNTNTDAPIRYKVNNFYNGLNNYSGHGLEERESGTYIVKDDRFPLGTYTEENKRYWELQTSDPISRNSQFSSPRMYTACLLYTSPSPRD